MCKLEHEWEQDWASEGDFPQQASFYSDADESREDQTAETELPTDDDM